MSSIKPFLPEPFLPEHIRDAMKLYLEDGVEPGSFLTAVLSNDLRRAVLLADKTNLQHLTNIVSYCYSCVPCISWGSPELVEAWLKRFRVPQTLEETNEV